MKSKRAQLEAILRRNTPIAIAYSGGVDSACLLAVACQAVGDEAVAVIADSPSLPRKALADALDLARGLGARIEVVRTEELENPEYASNPINRCYFCKAELFLQMDRMARERGFRAIAYGENADDPAHLRPGSQAAKEFSVLAPLRDAGLTKAEVRELSRELGLPTADQPAQPCLSSRIPHGTRVTPDALRSVELAEEGVRALGFRVFRVRYLEREGGVPAARLQVAPEEFPHLEAHQEAAVGAVLRAGFGAVEIDPDGYQSPAAALSR